MYIYNFSHSSTCIFFCLINTFNEETFVSLLPSSFNYTIPTSSNTFIPLTYLFPLTHSFSLTHLSLLAYSFQLTHLFPSFLGYNFGFSLHLTTFYLQQFQILSCFIHPFFSFKLVNNLSFLSPLLCPRPTASPLTSHTITCKHLSLCTTLPNFMSQWNFPSLFPSWWFGQDPKGKNGS